MKSNECGEIRDHRDTNDLKYTDTPVNLRSERPTDNYDAMMQRALAPSDQPPENINRELVRQIRSRGRKKSAWYRRMPTAAAAAMAVIILLTGGLTVYAAWRLLTPQEVARELGDTSFEKSLAQKNEISENGRTQTSRGYEISLIGLVSGDKLRDYGYVTDENGLISDNTYSLVAIRRENGQDIGDKQFLVSPLIHGEAPWQMNIFYMGGGAESFTKDGVLYCVADCENLECFADRGVYLSITDDIVLNRETFLYDKASGDISLNKEYDGVTALFQLPLDKKKADSKKASALLKKWRESAEADDRDANDGDEDNGNEALSAAERRMSEEWTGERVKASADIIKETVQTIQPDADGNYGYSWELGEGDCGTGTVFHDSDTFRKAKNGELVVELITESDEKLIFVTYRKNDDGTITIACYQEN